MTASRSRQFVSLVLVVGAVAFGMVLAGSLDLTVPSAAAPEPAAQAISAPVQITGTMDHLPSFADLAEAVEPAVVSVTAATIEQARRPGRTPGFPFDFFFGPRQRQQQGPDDEQQPREFRRDAGGSGFIVSSDGYIVTNNHVIEGASKVTVRIDDRDYDVTVKGTDPETDIALLKVDAGRALKYLSLGDSDALRVGDWVMAIGSPLNLDHTVTVGVVSAKGRSIGLTDPSFENFIQTDAAINFGNSGGPLLNLRGEVVGINSAINFGAENIGFAIPVSTLKTVLPQLRDKGRVSRGYLGVDIGDVDYKMAKAFGLEKAEGALVSAVRDDTPAAKAGLEHGDIILEVDGHKIERNRDLINYVSSAGPGTTVTLNLLRNGEHLTKKVTLEERPPITNEQEQPESEPESGVEWLGVQYQDLSPVMRQRFNIPDEVHGVMITQVEPTSPLYDERVQPHDVISEVNGKKVDNAADFESVVRSAKSGTFLRLYVQRFDPRLPRAVSFFAVIQVP